MLGWVARNKPAKLLVSPLEAIYYANWQKINDTRVLTWGLVLQKIHKIKYKDSFSFTIGCFLIEGSQVSLICLVIRVKKTSEASDFISNGSLIRKVNR